MGSDKAPLFQSFPNLLVPRNRCNLQKSNGAAMDNNYMLTVLTACLSQHDDDTSQTACQ